jgi:gamma-glutamyltranspeptidase / glutathione hydrolase
MRYLTLILLPFVLMINVTGAEPNSPGFTERVVTSKESFEEFRERVLKRSTTERREWLTALVTDRRASPELLAKVHEVLSPEQWMLAVEELGQAPGKSARGKAAVVAGSPWAAAGGLEILEEGGNAADAAAACLAVLWVTDPANTSVAGRCQIVGWIDGEAFALGGATQSPSRIERPGEGWGLAPIPGSPMAVMELVRTRGSLPLKKVLEPAIRLARDGFEVTPHLAEVWESRAQSLAHDPDTASIFLPNGAPPRVGEIFRQPLLADALENLENFYQGPPARQLAREYQHGGGWVTEKDLADYRVIEPPVLRTEYRGYEVLTPGGNTWGHTLIEMLNILNLLEMSELSEAQQEEAVAWAILAALADRPQELGTLKPKPNGLPLELLIHPALSQKRSRQIEQLLGASAEEALPTLKSWVEQTGSPLAQKDYDTTHLSVIDADGNAVALTTSIGRHFGARVASPSQGFLMAQSYLMAHAPKPGARDQTEMTPTLLLQDGRVVAALGAAGSERIPQATLQTIVNLVDRGLSLSQAVNRPRLGWKNGKLRLHVGFRNSSHLEFRGFPIRWTGWTHVNHLGIVQAVTRDEKGTVTGAADRAYDGQVRTSF